MSVSNTAYFTNKHLGTRESVELRVLAREVDESSASDRRYCVTATWRGEELELEVTCQIYELSRAGEMIHVIVTRDRRGYDVISSS